MKKKCLLLLLLPLIMATQCDDDFSCGFADFEGFDLTVENTQATYGVNEVIWIDATAPSMIANGCNENELEIVTNPSLFQDSLFIVELVESADAINSEIITANIIYEIGAPFSFDSCDSAINIEPVLSNDEETYTYRLGISFDTPGDYCITIGRYPQTSINNDTNVNAEIYEPYSNSDNTIKFNNCGITYTRELTSGNYFVSIQ